MAKGEFRTAARICTERLTASASDIPLLAMLTSACEHAGELTKAREAAVRWVQAAPLDPYAHYKLAMLHQRLQNYAEASRRLHLAANLPGPDDDVQRASREALEALDVLQLEQVEALREVDLCFRIKLRLDPRAVLLERGFALSAEALSSLDDETASPAYEAPPPMLS